MLTALSCIYYSEYTTLCPPGNWLFSSLSRPLSVKTLDSFIIPKGGSPSHNTIPHSSPGHVPSSWHSPFSTVPFPTRTSPDNFPLPSVERRKNGAEIARFSLDFRLVFLPKVTISCGLTSYFSFKPQFRICIITSTFVEGIIMMAGRHNSPQA